MLVPVNEELGAFEVYGSDANMFLQGQLTNDIDLLETNNFQYSAYLNTKGRMLAILLVKKIEQEKYLLVTTASLVDKVVTKLSMYILRSKVVVNKLQPNLLFTDDFSCDKLNSNNYFKLTDNHYVIVEGNNLNNQKSNTLFKKHLITNGIPLIYPETSEELIPQHVNFDEIGGLNFNKGCYLGQEIVARMHYLGKAKRKMYYFSTERPTEIGNKIVSPKLNNQECGMVVNVILDDIKKTYIGLVVLQTDCLDSAFIDKENNHKLTVSYISYR